MRRFLAKTVIGGDHYLRQLSTKPYAIKMREIKDILKSADLFLTGSDERKNDKDNHFWNVLAIP